MMPRTTFSSIEPMQRGLSKILSRFVIDGYRGRRIYQLDYKGFPSNMHAEMVVEVSYDAPALQATTEIR
jgi:hypothetical protein